MILKRDSLDCQRRGSDNTIGDFPFVAPMKTELPKAVNLEKKPRNGVALLFCVCLSLFVFTAAAAQVEGQQAHYRDTTGRGCGRFACDSGLRLAFDRLQSLPSRRSVLCQDFARGS